MMLYIYLIYVNGTSGISDLDTGIKIRKEKD